MLTNVLLASITVVLVYMTYKLRNHKDIIMKKQIEYVVTTSNWIKVGVIFLALIFFEILIKGVN